MLLLSDATKPKAAIDGTALSAAHRAARAEARSASLRIPQDPSRIVRFTCACTRRGFCGLKLRSFCAGPKSKDKFGQVWIATLLDSVCELAVAYWGLLADRYGYNCGNQCPNGDLQWMDPHSARKLEAQHK